MSELSVGTLSGLAANSYVIDVASGSTLDLSNATSLPSSALPTGTILQVVSTTKTDTFSTSSTSFTNLTGLSATITPSSTSSKILIIVSLPLNGGPNFGAAEIERNGTTSVGSGTPVGSRRGAFGQTYFTTNSEGRTLSMNHLDSPNTTSATTYQVNVMTNTGTIYAGRSASDTDNNGAQSVRTSSTITLMEVAG